MSTYQIYVGRKRENNAIFGALVKGRNDIIQGETKPASIKVGVYGVPNYTQAWGVRLVKGSVPETPVSAENPNYTGEIKPLKWGDPKGTMIECRWVRGHSTIDQSYQDLRLKLPIKEDSIDTALILLQHGFNEFDENRDKSLVDILKVHGMNQNSISKHPEYAGEMYREINQEIIDKKETLSIDSKFECLKTINEASSSNESVKVLFDIVNGVELSQVNRDDVAEVFSALKLFADNQPAVFAERFNNYKINVSTVLEKAKVFKLFDVTKDGLIAVSDTKGANKEILSVDAKGEKMINYLFDNLLNAEAYDFIEKTKNITDKLK